MEFIKLWLRRQTFIHLHMRHTGTKSCISLSKKSNETQIGKSTQNYFPHSPLVIGCHVVLYPGETIACATNLSNDYTRLLEARSQQSASDELQAKYIWAVQICFIDMLSNGLCPQWPRVLPWLIYSRSKSLESKWPSRDRVVLKKGMRLFLAFAAWLRVF